MLRYGFRVPVVAIDGDDRLEAPITAARPRGARRRAASLTRGVLAGAPRLPAVAGRASAPASLLGVLAAIPLLRGDGSGTQGTLVGKPAPAIAADDLDGRRWTLADGADRITWVNFWATNCEPCRTEMPAMQRLADAYGDRLLVLGVDWGESRLGRRLRRPIRDRLPDPARPDPRQLLPLVGLDGLPRHYFVDGEGTVVREVIGPLAPARMLEIVEELIGPA